MPFASFNASSSNRVIMGVEENQPCKKLKICACRNNFDWACWWPRIGINKPRTVECGLWKNRVTSFSERPAVAAVQFCCNRGRSPGLRLIQALDCWSCIFSAQESSSHRWLGFGSAIWLFLYEQLLLIRDVCTTCINTQLADWPSPCGDAVCVYRYAQHVYPSQTLQSSLTFPLKMVIFRPHSVVAFPSALGKQGS